MVHSVITHHHTGRFGGIAAMGLYAGLADLLCKKTKAQGPRKKRKNESDRSLPTGLVANYELLLYYESISEALTETTDGAKSSLDLGR